MAKTARPSTTSPPDLQHFMAIIQVAIFAAYTRSIIEATRHLTRLAQLEERQPSKL
ncbi:hypothetical protein PROFUN_05989 [Planoprotostelium fungivorum]|uniref:Uncharacterized protein n=1 Tax=Planoprotostelium fungivorum TaxID=1890364 RepID=A0A2P6NP97_9EUKA|nr:hypothetical protein PROFUN_05989 [Planoprotostelium fungivorum]